MPRKFIGGYKEASEAAGPYWEKLSEQEKAPYIQKAKEAKEAGKNQGKNYKKSNQNKPKLASNGIPLAEIEQREIDCKAKIQEKRDLIDQIINYGLLNNCKFPLKPTKKY